MKEIVSKIEKLGEDFLPKDQGVFITDVMVKPTQSLMKILVLLDGDDGVTIDHCAKFSRVATKAMEDFFDNLNYTLEVSSPGIDKPLTCLRQYKKNIERNVKTITNDGKEICGVLTSVDGDVITIQKKNKTQQKHNTYDPVNLHMSEIKKTVVQVSFKK